MKNYQLLLQDILENGCLKADRTGVGTRSLFGSQLRFQLQDGFPLITTKKIHLKSIIYELLWFLKGDTNIDYLNKNGVNIWNEWANKNGDLGPIYGAQWRDWNKDGVDQISNLITQIKTQPDSRRHLVTAWNPNVLPDSNLDFSQNVSRGKAALPPCHVLFQFYVSNNKLSCQLYQRSADIFLGVPFNIASYALLTMMIAQVCGLKPDAFIITFGDVHLYNNHINQAKIQLQRTPKKRPTMTLNKKVMCIFDFKYDDFFLENYNPHPTIKAPIAI